MNSSSPNWVVNSLKIPTDESLFFTEEIKKKQKRKSWKRIPRSTKVTEVELSTDGAYVSTNEGKQQRNRRLHRREAIYKTSKRSNPSDDKSSFVSFLFPAFYFTKTHNGDQTHDDKSSDDGQFGNSLELHASLNAPTSDKDNTNKKKYHSTDPLQITELGVDSALDSSSSRKNVDPIRNIDEITASLQSSLDTGNQVEEVIKLLFLNDQLEASTEVNRPSDEGTNDRISHGISCIDPSIWDFLFSTQPDLHSTLLSVPVCSANQNTELPQFHFITKKSVIPLPTSLNNQSLPIPSSGCQHRIETKLISLSGCARKSILFLTCQGTCHSRSVPQWIENDGEVQQIEYCTCCSSFSMRFRNITFECPGRPVPRHVVRIGFPFQCACRPCANVPEIPAGQPYDY